MLLIMFKKIILTVFFLLLVSLLFFSFYSYNENSFQFYNGGDKRIQCFGRFDKTQASSPKVWAPGAYIEFDFKGAFCEIEIEDELRYFVSHNYIEVVIDDGIPKRIKLSGKFNRINIGENLSKGTHHVLICKNTESSIGYIKFLGVRCAKLMPSKKRNSKYFEFIGDSITCGNGSDSSQIKFNSGTWYDYHNAYLSYGAILARELDAEYSLSAISGIGLENSCCDIDYTMPDVYDRIAFDKNHEKWNSNNYPKPNIVFITLGQNDGLKNEEAYEKKYLEFLRNLRTNYKKSTIICCTSPMASEKFKLQMKNSIEKVVNYRRQNGDKKIFAFVYNGTYNSGYDKHPTIQQHELIKRELHSFLVEKKLI